MKSIALLLAGTALLIAPGFDFLGGLLIGVALFGLLVAGIDSI